MIVNFSVKNLQTKSVALAKRFESEVINESKIHNQKILQFH